MTPRHEAILLLGPTGSGKTPLGNFLEEAGLPGGVSCRHFDFGSQLRRLAAAPTPPPGLSLNDIGYVSDILNSGALLPDSRFYIAGGLLRDFMNATREKDIIILNGLPRHIGQARAVDRIIGVTKVIRLHCEAETVYNRIRLNSGGDRTGRNDDSQAMIAAKLATYGEKTAPLLDYYAANGCHIISIEIGVKTTPQDIRRRLR